MCNRQGVKAHSWGVSLHSIHLPPCSALPGMTKSKSAAQCHALIQSCDHPGRQDCISMKQVSDFDDDRLFYQDRSLPTLANSIGAPTAANATCLRV